MKRSLPTVTAAVCAFNEEKNIRNFLVSVLKQKQDGYRLKKVVVVNDGSTDQTAKIVFDLQKENPVIECVDYSIRIGKSSHLNTIYRNLSTDFLVQSDADVCLAHINVIRDLIQPLIKEERVGMCGGNPMPAIATTFWEKMVAVAFEPYLTFRSSVRDGNNIFSAIGQLLAYKRELVKNITIPATMITNDIFTYFCCLQSNWQYRFVPTAIVLFQSPRRLTDVLKQNTRFLTGQHRMQDYFPATLVTKEFHIPKTLYIQTLLKQVVRYPIHSFMYYVINTYCRLQSRVNGTHLNAKWPMAITTKRFIRL